MGGRGVTALCALAGIWLFSCCTALGAVGPVTIDEVAVTGNARVEEEAIRVHINAHPGELLEEDVVEKDIRAIYGMGFFDDVQAHLVRRGERWVLTYQVTERPLIREVRVVGNKEISTDDVEGALRIRPRTIFNPEKVRRAMEEAQKLYQQKGYLDAHITYRTDPAGDGEVAVVFAVEEKDLVRVKKIVFEGNRALTDKALKKVMGTRQKWFLSRLTGAGVLDHEVLRTDMDRLTAYYYDHGYIEVKIDEPEISRGKDGLYVRVKIDEGKQYQVGKVDFGGDLPEEPGAVKKSLTLTPGEVFRASKLRDDIFSLTEYFSNRGYAFVNVEPETLVHPEKKRVDIVYRIDQGQEVFFNTVEITGNTKTRDKVIRRELKVDEQGRFSAASLRRSRELLERLGFFEEVNVTTRRGEEDEGLNVLVDVKEGQTGSFSAGAGISSVNNLLFNVRFQENNLFGRGQQLVANADLGSLIQNFTLSFTEPYFRDTPLTVGFDAFNWLLVFDDFDRTGTGLNLRSLYPLTGLGYSTLWGLPLEEVRAGMEYRIERAKISDLDFFSPPSIQSERGTSLISSVRPILVRNTLNHPFDPTAGSRQVAAVEVAGLGGERFLKFEAENRWYRPIYRSPSWGTTAFMTGVRLGYGLGDAGISGEELPLFERYFPGGIDSVRGFRRRTLGPREEVVDGEGNVIDTDPIGGTHQLIFNNEVIFPLVEPLGLKGVVFVDAGNAFSGAEGFDFTEMRLSVGWGVRWRSPFGPVRIEVGRPLNARPEDNTATVDFAFGSFSPR